MPEPIVSSHAIDDMDNHIRPFQMDGMDIRGRIVRMGTVIEQILNKHNYPEPVAYQVGDLLVITALVGGLLKNEGTVTVQIKGAGPLKMAVADYTLNKNGCGYLRGYAQIDPEKLARLGKNPSLKALTGVGYLALTIDQNENNKRYQGIVELDGSTLGECAEDYFEKSEQTRTKISSAVTRDPTTKHWRAGGIMIQHLPNSKAGRTPHGLQSEQDDHWQRAKILLATTKAQELTDPLLTSDQLLFRLFHEDGVRVHPQTAISFGCRCSRERLEVVIKSLSDDDIEHALEEENFLTATCEFCNTHYKFSDEDIKALRQ